MSVHAVLRLALGLSRRAQLDVYEQLGAYLGDVGEPESKHARRVRSQREALDVLERVAAAAQLPAGKAPSRTQFAGHAAALGIGLTVSAIARLFGGWANAQAMYERRVLPETGRQVRQRQMLRSHHGRSPVEALALFSQWADQADDLTRRGYELWRKNYTSEAADKGIPLPLSEIHLRRVFPGLTFEELIELRHTSGDLTDMLRQRTEKTLAEQPNPLGLVTLMQAAALLGKPETFVRHRVDSEADGQPDDFPVMVAVVGQARSLLAEDVRDYARTGGAPRRAVGAMQDQLQDRRHLSRTLGMKLPAFDRAAARHKVPPPDGHVGLFAYWLTSTIEAWPRPAKER
ncbi:MAG: hypothetical protein LC808_24985 [Actinobacteria bacterium]|nr:hypothetical protein [Actinomycetota bacterium]